MIAICSRFSSPDRVINSSCGNYVGLCLESRNQRARTPRLARFILLGGLSDILLVVPILDIVHDCHL